VTIPSRGWSLKGQERKKKHFLASQMQGCGQTGTFKRVILHQPLELVPRFGKRLVSALEDWGEPASSRHTGHFCVPHNTALFCSQDSPPQLPPSLNHQRPLQNISGEDHAYFRRIFPTAACMSPGACAYLHSAFCQRCFDGSHAAPSVHHPACNSRPNALESKISCAAAD